MSNLSVSFVCGKQGNHAPGVAKHPGIHINQVAHAAFFIGAHHELSGSCMAGDVGYLLPVLVGCGDGCLLGDLWGRNLNISLWTHEPDLILSVQQFSKRWEERCCRYGS
ncbi:hypothetical protein [Erwinia sp. E602]|uniref:hypothetical protein n=1 Tax=Erwinia sp. E602 TaxID=2675378 RepID=UPI001BAB0E26|nr:hypothetical protein [Erwinia sp. E602]